MGSAEFPILSFTTFEIASTIVLLSLQLSGKIAPLVISSWSQGLVIVPPESSSMKSRNKKSYRRKSRRSVSNRHNFQLLEDRRLLATFSVTNTDLSGPGSLPQAIFDANNSLGADTIELSAGLGTIQLVDQLEVFDSVTIEGNGNTIACTDTIQYQQRNTLGRWKFPIGWRGHFFNFYSHRYYGY